MPPRSAKLLWLGRRDGVTLAGATTHMTGQGVAMTRRDGGSLVICEVHDTSEESVTLLVPGGRRFRVSATLAPYRGGGAEPLPVLADDREPDVLRLRFRVPACGRVALEVLTA